MKQKNCRKRKKSNNKEKFNKNLLRTQRKSYVWLKTALHTTLYVDKQLKVCN